MAGLVLGYGMLGALPLMDPLGIYNTYNWLGSEGFIWLSVMIVVSLLSYSFFGRPYVELKERVLVVQNAFRRWMIPRDSIVSVDFRGKYGRITLAHRKIRMLATERGNLGRWLGMNRFRGLEAANCDTGSISRGDNAAAQDAVRCSLDLHQSIILLGSLVYLVAAIVLSPHSPR